MTIPAAKSRSWIKLTLKLSLTTLLCFGLFLSSEAWYADVHAQAQRSLAEQSALAIDLSTPDALIESESLRDLPRALLDTKLLAGLLEEDFVFYYEHHADRLGVTGTLRKLAYEHKLALPESVVAQALAQPAQVALYRGPNGKLDYVFMRIQRGAVARMLQPFARMAHGADNQLQQVAQLHVGREAVPLYQLSYQGGARAILFAAYRNELIVLNAPGLALDANTQLARAAATVLERALQRQLDFRTHFELARKRGEHRLTAAAEVLSLGYGRLLESVQGISLERRGKQWQAQVAVKAGAAELNFAPLWNAMPMGASACAGIPINQSSVALLAGPVETGFLSPALAAKIKGPALICWYPESRLHTPLILTQVAAGDAQLDAAISASFEASIGAYERNTPAHRFPLRQTQRDPQHVLWQRVVSARFGTFDTASYRAPAEIDGPRYFDVSLLRHQNWLAFSLDSRLVEKSAQTIDQRFPALGERFDTRRTAAMYFAPKQLAALLEQEAKYSLPLDSEEILRNAMQARLLPKLAAFAKQPAFTLSFLPPKRASTQPLQWLELSAQ
jgi:uncharacterized protein YfaA (DUF2138 family)